MRHRFNIAAAYAGVLFSLALALSPSVSVRAASNHFSSGDDEEIKAALLYQQDISIEYLQGKRGQHHAAAHPQTDMISADEAIQDAKDSLGFLSGYQAGTALVSFTDRSFGPEVNEPGSDEGVVESPVYYSITCYAVTFTGVGVPVFGPGSGHTQEVSGVAFVDAYTGLVYEFATIDLTG